MRWQMAERDGLDQYVAGGGAFGRAGQHGDFQHVGGKLIEHHGLAAAPDDVQPLDFLPVNRNVKSLDSGAVICQISVMDGDERDIFQFLKTRGTDFVGVMEIARRAGNKKRFYKDPDWAKIGPDTDAGTRDS